MTAAPKSLIKDAPGLAKDEFEHRGRHRRRLEEDRRDRSWLLSGICLSRRSGNRLECPPRQVLWHRSGQRRRERYWSGRSCDALKNVEEAIKETIARLANRVADARHNVEKSTTAVDQYKAGLPGGQPQNAAQQAELQKLITNELKAQQALHDRLQEQQQAEIAAASGFEKYAAKISTHLKNHDELVRQAKDAALEHVRAAQQLGEEYLRIGVTVAQLKNDIRASFEGLVDRRERRLMPRPTPSTIDRRSKMKPIRLPFSSRSICCHTVAPARSRSMDRQQKALTNAQLAPRLKRRRSILAARMRTSRPIGCSWYSPRCTSRSRKMPKTRS